MRIRFCKICRNWHEADEPWPGNCTTDDNFMRSHLPAPMVITDTMAPVQSMLDGRMYDSKATLRATYRQAGVTEVGNDPARNKPTVREHVKPDRKKIKDTVAKAKARFNRGERVH